VCFDRIHLASHRAGESPCRVCWIVSDKTCTGAGRGGYFVTGSSSLALEVEVSGLLATPGPWQVSDTSRDDFDVLDCDGFPVAELPQTAVLTGWSEKFPKLKHWARGGEQTARERTDEELVFNAVLISKAHELFAIADELCEAFAGDDRLDEATKHGLDETVVAARCVLDEILGAAALVSP
jgi:hypothetical protein